MYHLQVYKRTGVKCCQPQDICRMPMFNLLVNNKKDSGQRKTAGFMFIKTNPDN